MSQENVEVVNAAYAAINRRDLGAFLALLDPEVEFRSLIAELEDKTFQGHDGAREWWDSVMGAFEGMRFDVADTQTVREDGVTQIRVVATINGADVLQTMWTAWGVRDGCVRWWATFRTESEALEAVGLRE